MERKVKVEGRKGWKGVWGDRRCCMNDGVWNTQPQLLFSVEWKRHNYVEASSKYATHTILITISGIDTHYTLCRGTCSSWIAKCAYVLPSSPTGENVNGKQQKISFFFHLINVEKGRWSTLPSRVFDFLADSRRSLCTTWKHIWNPAHPGDRQLRYPLSSVEKKDTHNQLLGGSVYFS